MIELFALIALAWIGIALLVVSVCVMAAQGDGRRPLRRTATPKSSRTPAGLSLGR